MVVLVFTKIALFVVQQRIIGQGILMAKLLFYKNNNPDINRKNKKALNFYSVCWYT